MFDIWSMMWCAEDIWDVDLRDEPIVVRYWKRNYTVKPVHDSFYKCVLKRKTTSDIASMIETESPLPTMVDIILQTQDLKVSS